MAAGASYSLSARAVRASQFQLAFGARVPGKALNWNVQAMKIANDPAAQRLLRRTHRKGWQVAGL